MKDNQGNSNQNLIMKVLDLAYSAAINGLPGCETAQEMAEDYMKHGGKLTDNVNSLIAWQISKASTSGFITGVGGLITMPVTIPANITSILYIQVRMIAAVAYMGGHDLHDDKVKTFVYICMAGNSAKDFMKNIGIEIGNKLTLKMIQQISGKTISEINRKVSFRLLTKFGEKGTVNLWKSAPFIGGFIGAAFDGLSTKAIGEIAKTTFIL